MNRYSIALLVGVAVLCTGLSSGIPDEAMVARVAAHVDTGWNAGMMLIRRERFAQR